MMSRHFQILALASGLMYPSFSPAIAETPLPVLTVTAEMSRLETEYVLVGEITAPETLQAAFPVGGRLTEVAVETGDVVTRGMELARIEQVQQVQAVASAEATLAAAEAEYTAAKHQADRQDELFERGATTRSDRDAADDRLAAAVATRSQAQATLDQAQKALDDTVLIAQADGTVTDRIGEPGQVVGAAQPVLEMAKGDGFEAKFEVPETVLTATQETPGIVQLSALDRPEITVPGHVSEISPLVDPARGTIEVTVVLDEPVPGLTYGDAVRGATKALAEPSIVVPWPAISSNAQGASVWVVDPADGSVQERNITIDRYTKDQILIADGVSPAMWS